MVDDQREHPHPADLEGLDDGEIAREVYAVFGLAYYRTEVFHATLSNLYAVGLISDPRLATSTALEERMKSAFGKTLGETAGLVKDLIPPECQTSVRVAIDVRNELAHGFWWKNSGDMLLSDGKRRVHAFLCRVVHVLGDVDRQIQAVVDSHLERLRLAEAVRAEWERLSQNPENPDPFPNRRHVKPRERIVQVWRGRLDTTVFESEDGDLWMCAEHGLTWYPRSRSDLEVHADLSPLVPADLSCTSKSKKGIWNYTLHFSTGWLLQPRVAEHGKVQLVLRPARSRR